MLDISGSSHHLSRTGVNEELPAGAMQAAEKGLHLTEIPERPTAGAEAHGFIGHLRHD
jgi:hypothetical protein